MTAPTARQLAIVEWMRAYQLEHAMPPTIREIANEFGFASTNAVVDHLTRASSHGLVRHRPTIARGWVALPADERQVVEQLR